MNPVEKTDCPSCKRPILLSYVPTRDPMLEDHWTCPYEDCGVSHPSSRKGTVVIVVQA